MRNDLVRIMVNFDSGPLWDPEWLAERVPKLVSEIRELRSKGDHLAMACGALHTAYIELCRLKGIDGTRMSIVISAYASLCNYYAAREEYDGPNN